MGASKFQVTNRTLLLLLLLLLWFLVFLEGDGDTNASVIGRSKIDSEQPSSRDICSSRPKKWIPLRTDWAMI